MAVVGERILVVLRSELKKNADREKAPQMQQYMKSLLPYHGVPSPLFKTICKKLFKDLEFKSHGEWQRVVTYIWTYARFREERYGALNLCGHKSAKDFQTPESFGLYEKLITSGAWWDFVDDIATHRFAQILRSHPKETKKLLLEWSTGKNIWKRRTGIICQVNFMEKEFDQDLLYRCIEPSIPVDEFFLQKAIGWGLRSMAWIHPKKVIQYVEENQARMSGLSRREALKNLVRYRELSQKKFDELTARHS